MENVLIDIDFEIMDLYDRRGQRVSTPPSSGVDGRESEVSSFEETYRMALEADPNLEQTAVMHRSMYCEDA